MALTQISTAGVKDDAVTAGKIPANAVGSSELADNAVDTNAIQDDAVTANKIAANAVTGDKIASNSISTAKIQNSAVDATTLQVNSVTTAKIADEAVTLAKLPHGDGSSNGKFLRANNGADPTFETVDFTNLNASSLTSGTIPDARFPATLPAISGANLTGVSSPEVYGFTGLANGNLQVTTTNGGADNISGTDFDAFEDVIFAATGFTFSVNANGKLIATI